MKFIVSSSVLFKSLTRIKGVVAANPIVPILENFLFQIKGGTLTVTASDLQSTMTVDVPVDSADDGSVCVPAKLLLDTLGSLPEQPVTIHINGDTFGVVINSDNGQFKISGDNAFDYPKMPGVNRTGSVDLSSDALLSAINYTAFATSTDGLRPAMTGVYLELGADRVAFVSTDGNRLVRYRRTDVQTTESTSLIIPRKALGLLKASLPEGIVVKVELSQANASFTFGPIQLICRLIDERYIDYENAIPVNNTNRMLIGRADLLASLKRIMIYANKSTHQIRLTLKTNSLTIAAEDLDYSNEADEHLFCEYDGEEMEIGFNAKLLTEMLGNLDARIVKLDLSAPNRAGILLPAETAEHEELMMMIMPVMLNQYA